jgi:uncharacterized BrkB/YihY/UPF0761 family membrane protein
MLELLRSPSRSAATAILYVTIGTLMVIWAGLWYFYFLMPQTAPPAWEKFACVGTILSGCAIAVIGFLFGSIGRDAKAADNAVGVASSGSIAPVVAGDVAIPSLVGETVVPVSASRPVTVQPTPISAGNR